jgi:hypothetical protein
MGRRDGELGRGMAWWSLDGWRKKKGKEKTERDRWACGEKRKGKKRGREIGGSHVLVVGMKFEIQRLTGVENVVLD